MFIVCMVVPDRLKTAYYCLQTPQMPAQKSPPPQPVELFATKRSFATWLDKNHAKTPGLWLRFGKKGSGVKSISYEEALEIALCYGWIDTQVRGESPETYVQKFLPRASKSIWSKVNCAKATDLIAKGLMHPAGLAAIENAKANGRWDAAYDPPSTSVVPPDLKAALDANPKAKSFFETLNGANRYAILWRIQTARKAETRARKIETLIGMLERGEKIHESR